MAEYIVGSISVGVDTVEVWRCDEKGARIDRINLKSLDICGKNRSLRFEFDNDNIIVTDAFDSGYIRKFSLGSAGHNDFVEPV